jgi:hypothetical protein
MLISNQVAEDNQLLNIVRDYLQFVTNFFEVIDASATHIYHSALELSPLSSIVRKLYYSQRPLLPRVVIGIPDSWDPSITSISTKNSKYLSSIWSPCSQFIAAVTRDALEIRDASTLKLLSTIQSTKVGTRFRPGLAYSPDGCSLAGCSDTGIVIWDTQTGGMVKKIVCEVTGDGLELVWLLNGMMIGTISLQESAVICTVHTYGVASGEIQSSSALRSMDSSHLWAHNGSFWVMTATRDYQGQTINIFKVGSTLTKVEQFPIKSRSSLGIFSPTTYRISALGSGYIWDQHALLILDVRSSKVLLQERDSHQQHTFSPDGASFAASMGDHFIIWRYTSSGYTRWREFQQDSTILQFSPTSLSILGCASALLHISHLDSHTSLVVAPAIKTCGQPWGALSPNGAYIVAAHEGESTITITNLNFQYPSTSQFINTDLEISAMALTGNVLLVRGPDTVVAWLLTEEGMVDRMFGNTRASCNDSLWRITPPQPIQLGQPPQSWNDGACTSGGLAFLVEGEIAVISHNECAICVYHTRTGEILELDKVPRSFNYHFSHPFQDECELYHCNLFKHCGPLEYDWPVSHTTLRDGWVKDPEGKHWLWLHTRWRSPETIDWLHNATTLRLRTPSELIIIKF